MDFKTKMQVSGKVIKLGLAGAVVDIGSTQPAILHISQLPIETKDTSLLRVEDVLELGQTVDVWIKRVRSDHIELTMNKPLDLEWREIKTGMTVKGKIVRLEKFGAFVDIGAERPGLVHISELAHGYVRSPEEIVKEGDEVEAEVLDVQRKKKQIKLSMKALEEKPEKVVKETQTQAPRAAAVAEEAPKEKAIPTAMEMALREAMERSKSREPVVQVSRSKQKPAAGSNEIEQILARTLKNKAKTK